MTNFTVDTNILIYSVDPTDSTKHSIAKTVMTSVYSRGGSLPLQCLSEFYAACAKKHLAPLDKIAEVVDRAINSM